VWGEGWGMFGPRLAGGEQQTLTTLIYAATKRSADSCSGEQTGGASTKVEHAVVVTGRKGDLEAEREV